MKIVVLTAVYPTAEEPSRGLPIWATLARFRGKVDFTVDCSLPRAPGWVRRAIRPRSYLRYPGTVDTTVNPAVPARPLEYFSIPGITRSWNGRLLARSLEKRIRDDRPDLILAYRVYPDGYAAVVTARRLRIPVVIGSRGSDLKKIPPRGLVRRDTVNAVIHAEAVLCVSEDLVRIARRLGGGDRVHHVRNGIDPSIFHPIAQDAARKQLGVPPTQRLVLFVGNLDPVKGLPTLLRAIRFIKESGETWHAALIGEGQQESDLRRMADQLGIGLQVSFLGARSPREIAVWLNACDTFCLPSESEGLPNVVIEAIACGRNVVGTDVGGIPELVTEDAGLIVPRGDASALAKAILTAGTVQWDREKISAQSSWTWEETARQTLRICDSVLESRGVKARR